MTTSVGFWGVVLTGAAWVFGCEGTPEKVAQMSDAGADGAPVGDDRGSDPPGQGGKEGGGENLDPSVNGGDAQGGTQAAGGTANSGSGIKGSIVVRSSATQGVFSYKTEISFGADGLDACNRRVEGACTIDECSPGSTPTAFPHVGTISISGGSKALSLTPSANGAYPEATGSGIYWSPGVSVLFSAEGGTLPAFPATEIEPPEVVTDVLVNGEVAPIYPAQLTLSREQPLELSWTGGNHSIGFTLGQVSGLSARVIICRTTSDAGAFSIPETVLAALAAAPGSLQFVQTSIKEVAAGAAKVSVGLATHPNPGVVVFNVE